MAIVAARKKRMVGRVVGSDCIVEYLGRRMARNTLQSYFPSQGQVKPVATESGPASRWRQG
jgi:hypothetical protein